VNWLQPIIQNPVLLGIFLISVVPTVAAASFFLGRLMSSFATRKELYTHVEKSDKRFIAMDSTLTEFNTAHGEKLETVKNIVNQTQVTVARIGERMKIKEA
jgi:hypothetical protein